MRSAGARLILVDPRRTATAAKADLFLQTRPGTDLALLNGLLHLLVVNGHTSANSAGPPTSPSARNWRRTGRPATSTSPSPATSATRSTSGTGCASTAPAYVTADKRYVRDVY
ncbi:molybdopterin-dependent oxidoreductase [Streptomyces sp. NRRL B-3648]|uniref:molybdopterin-dependent oxidoreductase n=1 Tax=Streptomyces sp. NRRL B-3648 TaxID=1519493 RepID=UPI0006AEC333|nr:molybdopterin-dependent oxidoreductase [Streptomyces sp. NRRL B-3648]KOX11145.1 hypothetical protein ADL04_02440 [Streptomyces sp. NRRL B-3648]